MWIVGIIIKEVMHTINQITRDKIISVEQKIELLLYAHQNQQVQHDQLLILQNLGQEPLQKLLRFHQEVLFELWNLLASILAQDCSNPQFSPNSVPKSINDHFKWMIYIDFILQQENLSVYQSIAS